jgi:hypothetical protein
MKIRPVWTDFFHADGRKDGCWFSQKWLLNRIKNDDPQDCSSSDSEREFGKENVVRKFCSKLLDTWAKERSSHILSRHYCDGRCTQKISLTKLYGRWNLVLCLWPLTKRQSSEWVGETSPWPKKLKFRKSRIKTILIIFLDSQGVVHKEFTPEGKTVTSEFYRVMVASWSAFNGVRPAAFCARDFFLLHNNAPAHKAATVCQFLTPKILQHF